MRLRMQTALLSLALLGTTLFGACHRGGIIDPPGNGNGNGNNSNGKGLTITGKIGFRQMATIPADARVLIAWEVSSGSPDYSYVFGEGKVNMADSSFSITLTRDLPAGAINSSGLGVGAIFLTTNKAIKEGPYNDEDDMELGTPTGLAEEYGVIYVKPGTRSAAPATHWRNSFPDGYSVGKGVEIKGPHDGFTPVAPNSVILFIDEGSHLRWVNWT